MAESEKETVPVGTGDVGVTAAVSVTEEPKLVDDVLADRVVVVGGCDVTCNTAAADVTVPPALDTWTS